MVIVLCGCSGGPKQSAEKHAAPTTSASSPITTSRVSTAIATSAGQSALAGFNPLSFTAVSESDYWLLGSVPCHSGRCNAIVRTTNGGTSFAHIPAPPLPPLERAQVTPALRFADRRDGFAFVPGWGSVFYATHDGGLSWHRLALRTVLGFATGGGYSYVVTARCSMQRCREYRFERSPVSADAWRAEAMPFAPSSSILGLAAHGASVWLLGAPAGKERFAKTVLARSSDGGRTFVTGVGPCFPDLGGYLAPTSASVVWAVCPTGMLSGAWRSTDGGVTFTRLRTPPMVNAAGLAPASRNTAVLAGNGAGSRLERTSDGGATWVAVRAPGKATFVPWVGFTDARVGAALAQTGWDGAAKFEIQVLWRTTDGGAHWSTVRFR